MQPILDGLVVLIQLKGVASCYRANCLDCLSKQPMPPFVSMNRATYVPGTQPPRNSLATHPRRRLANRVIDSCRGEETSAPKFALQSFTPSQPAEDDGTMPNFDLEVTSPLRSPDLGGSVDPDLQEWPNPSTPDCTAGPRHHRKEAEGRTSSQYAANFEADRCTVRWKRYRTSGSRFSTLGTGTEHTPPVLRWKEF